MTIVGTESSRDVVGTDLRRTARTTGLLYLGFFVSGILGSMWSAPSSSPPTTRIDAAGSRKRNLT